jgi:nucleotide-binding universal stress UspA family protein
MYETVLVPTDGSDASLAAVDQGVEIARLSEGAVHFVHVVDVGIEMAASGVGTIADDLEDTLSSVAEDALDTAEERAEDAGVSSTRSVLEGDPHDAILAYGDEHGADLIVLGASGRSGLKERLLGSTTDRVAQTAAVSVLIARS